MSQLKIITQSLLILFFLVLFNCGTIQGSEINKEDEIYLKNILKDTWAYLDAHLAPETGFPTDTQHPGGYTNTTNIGLYLACIGPASEMGFLSHEEAAERVTKIIKSLKKHESNHGFLPNGVDVEGSTELREGVSAVSDFNKIVSGLILCRQYFPECSKDASFLIDRIDWGWLYDKETGQTRWGFDLKKNITFGDSTFWLASDCRLAVFYMIASEAAPPEIWDRTKRDKVKADGLEFYTPGYNWGGLFMQCMGGMFLDERGCEMGSSVGDFAWHQIREAQRRNLPVWGWSNCNVPCNGYTEGGISSLVGGDTPCLSIGY